MPQDEPIRAFTLAIDEAALLSMYRLLAPGEKGKLQATLSEVVKERRLQAQRAAARVARLKRGHGEAG